MQRTFLATFGFVSLIGGLMGYIMAGSLPSLIAGGTSGLLLLAGALLLGKYRWPALMTLVVSAVLAFHFSRTFFTSFKIAPAGVMLAFSLAGLVASTSLLRKIRRVS